MCFDANTGKVLWQHKFNVFFTDIVSVRLGWTNLVGDPETGNVYAHGTQGLLFCFDKDGKVLWWHSLTEEYGRVSGYGGRVTSPIVDGDLVIIGMLNASWGDQAIGGNRFVAFDKSTGKVVWWSQPGEILKDTYYSVPVVAVIGGQRAADHRRRPTAASTPARSAPARRSGATCSAPGRSTARRWWTATSSTSATARRTSTPPSRGGSSVSTLRRSRTASRSWSGSGTASRSSSPRRSCTTAGCTSATRSGRLYCLDAKTGKDIWKFKYGRSPKGSPVLADGKIYVAEVDSKLPHPQAGRQELPGAARRSSSAAGRHDDGGDNGSPAVANGRVYFMTSDEMYCIGKKGLEAGRTDSTPRGAAGCPGGKPAHLQVIPADVVLKPGETADFKVRVFDEQRRIPQGGEGGMVAARAAAASRREDGRRRRCKGPIGPRGQADAWPRCRPGSSARCWPRPRA